MTYFVNIEKETINNNYYRKVLNTTKTQQLVLMSLKPGEFIEIEKHKDTTQFIRIEAGIGFVEIGKIQKKKIKIKNNSVVIIKPNTWHYVKNTSKIEDLKLYTIYSPPEHSSNKIDIRQPILK